MKTKTDKATLATLANFMSVKNEGMKIPQKDGNMHKKVELMCQGENLKLTRRKGEAQRTTDDDEEEEEMDNEGASMMKPDMGEIRNILGIAMTDTNVPPVQDMNKDAERTAGTSSNRRGVTHYEQSPKEKTLVKGTDQDQQKRGARPTELYGMKDKGPYTVLIEYVTVDVETPLYAMRTGRVIRNLKKDIDVTITKVARTRNKLTFAKFEEANMILKSQELSKSNLRAYIPEYVLYSEGVISNVPPEITEDEIKEELEKKYKVKAVEKITRYDSRTNTKKATSSVKITFRECRLPEYVHIYYGRHPVSAYVYRPKICMRCFRYGHSTPRCKRAEKCCEFCGRTGHVKDACTVGTTCFYCQNSDHGTSDKRVCAEYKKQLAINNLMASDKMTFNEAAEKFKRDTMEYAANFRYARKDFPSLEEPFGTETEPERETVGEKAQGVTPRGRAKVKWIRTPEKRVAVETPRHVVGEQLRTDPIKPLERNEHRVSEFERIVQGFQRMLKQVDRVDDLTDDVEKMQVGEALQELLLKFGRIENRKEVPNKQGEMEEGEEGGR
jgi:RNA recognition motif-containing protein